jgi:hypothetical protein
MEVCSHREEEIGMKLMILIIITMLGLMMPLFWIIGTVTGIVYYYRRRVGATQEEPLPVFNPQLGLTMADGGDSIDKVKKE